MAGRLRARAFCWFLVQILRQMFATQPSEQLQLPTGKHFLQKSAFPKKTTHDI